jgi:hypothetical protein
LVATEFALRYWHHECYVLCAVAERKKPVAFGAFGQLRTNDFDVEVSYSRIRKVLLSSFGGSHHWVGRDGIICF